MKMGNKAMNRKLSDEEVTKYFHRIKGIERLECDYGGPEFFLNEEKNTLTFSWDKDFYDNGDNLTGGCCIDIIFKLRGEKQC